jgi:hypothetical protein
MIEGSNSWIRRHPRKALAIALAVLFLVLDAGLGAWLCPKVEGTPDAYYHHGLPKNFRGEVEWGYDRHLLVTNSLGFKDRENREVPRSFPGHRIVFMGDSFTEGVGVPYERTLPARFEEHAKNDGIVIDVLNAGVLSYSPKLYFLKTKYMINNINLKFDEMLVLADMTDIQDEIRYEEFTPSEFGISRHYLVNKADSIFKQYSLTYYAIRIILVNKVDVDRETVSHIAKDQEFLDNWTMERTIWDENDEVYERWGRYGVKLALANMKKLVDLCRENEIKVTLVVFPHPRQVLSRALDSKNVKLWEGFCRENNIDFINLYPKFIGKQDGTEVVKNLFIKGDVHWNEDGHIFVADAIYDNWKSRRQ